MLEKLENLLEDFKNIVEDIVEDTHKKILLSASLILALTGYMNMEASPKPLKVPQEQTKIDKDIEVKQLTDEELLIAALFDKNVGADKSVGLEMLAFMAITVDIDVEKLIGYVPFSLEIQDKVELTKNLIEEIGLEPNIVEQKRKKYETSIKSKYEFANDLKEIEVSIEEISEALNRDDSTIMAEIRNYAHGTDVWMNLSILEREFQQNLAKAKQNGTLRDINDIRNILEISTRVINFEKEQMLQVQIDPETNTISTIDDIIETIEFERENLLVEYQVIKKETNKEYTNEI